MFGLLRWIRRIIRFAVILLIVAGVIFVYQWLGSIEEEANATGAEPVLYEAMHHPRTQAIWLSQFDLSPIMTEQGRQREQTDYEKRITQALRHIKENGLNTVFVQVRPNGDSLYPSELFPASPYAVGQAGASFAYDPFAILLEIAHKEGLSVHAWINPLRLFRNEILVGLDEQFAHVRWCRENGDRAVSVDGVWYLNPAYGEVRDLVARGVREILSTYPVDGIHMDDYFYPTTAKNFDQISYERYRRDGGTLPLGDFRRNAVNGLVSLLYETVHSEPGNRVFGISPSGNIERNYNELYADTSHWCANTGYVDYLCPQVYFGLQHETHDFRSVCLDFDRMIQTDGIKLFVGMTLGKAHDGFYEITDRYAGSGAQEWIENQDVLARCLLVTRTLKHCDGVAYFSYQYLFSPESGEKNSATKTEWNTLLPYLVAYNGN